MKRKPIHHGKQLAMDQLTITLAIQRGKKERLVALARRYEQEANIPPMRLSDLSLKELQGYVDNMSGH